MTKHLYIHIPTVVCSGHIDASFDEVYPVADIPIVVDAGDTGDIRGGMTVIFGSTAGADDLGRQRVRKDHLTLENFLYIGYSPQGTHDGEVSIVDGSFFSVLDERRVWSKQQRIVEQGIEPFVLVYKDYELIFEDFGFDADNIIPPKANAGKARGGTRDNITGVLSLAFSSLDSFSIPMGIGIASVLWDFADGTITTGTSTSTDVIVDFLPGFRYIRLTVTDNNDLDHYMEIPVVVRDPSDDNCIDVWNASIQGDLKGQIATIDVYSNIFRSIYPDGTVVLIFDDDRVGHSVDFYGWIFTDNYSVEIVRTGAYRDTSLICYDLSNMLDVLPGQSLVVENKEEDRVFTVTAEAAAGAMIVIVSPITFALKIGDKLDLNSLGVTTLTMTSIAVVGATALGVAAIPVDIHIGNTLVQHIGPRIWGEFHHPEMYQVIDYIARWHSTAWELAHWSMPDVDAGYGYDVNSREIAAGTIYQQLQEQATSIGPDHNIGTNHGGQIAFRFHPFLIDNFFRPTEVWSSLNGHIHKVSSNHQRLPKYQWIRGGAVVEGWGYTSSSIRVPYIIRPSEFSDVTSTPIDIEPCPVFIPDGTVLNLIGLGGVRIPRITLTADCNVDDILLYCEPLTEPADVWDEYEYIATEAGPEHQNVVFCIAPGKIYGQGSQVLTVNNKIVQGQGTINMMVGCLWARLNSEYAELQIDLSDDTLDFIDCTEFLWVTASQLKEKYIPQRMLPFFETNTRFLPLEFTKNYSCDKTGVIGSFSLRIEREMPYIPAITIAEEDVV